MCLYVIGKAYRRMALIDNEDAIFAMKKEDRSPEEQSYYNKRVKEKASYKARLMKIKQECNKHFKNITKHQNNSAYTIAFENFHHEILDIFDSYINEDAYFGSKADAIERRLHKYWADLDGLGIIHRDKVYLQHVHRILDPAHLSYR
jgi:DNA-binding protein Fis